jgi:hypothetical protein
MSTFTDPSISDLLRIAFLSKLQRIMGARHILGNSRTCLKSIVSKNYNKELAGCGRSTTPKTVAERSGASSQVILEQAYSPPTTS